VHRAASLDRFPPTPANLTGTFAPNRLLAQHAVRLFDGEIHGAESVSLSPDGTLVMIDKFGFMHRAREHHRVDFVLQQERPLYVGPGRPLGFEIGGQGQFLLVCDSLKGLLRVELASGAISVLSNRATVRRRRVYYGAGCIVLTHCCRDR
jgi:hypothetical protein